jgi:hypothetical protein
LAGAARIADARAVASADDKRAAAPPCWIFPAGALVFVFTYMTSSGRLFVPFLFSFCSPEVNINGVGSRVLPSVI